MAAISHIALKLIIVVSASRKGNAAGNGKKAGNHVVFDGYGFTTTLLFNPLAGRNDRGSVSAQSLFPGQWLPCDSSAMTVTWVPQ